MAKGKKSASKKKTAPSFWRDDKKAGWFFFGLAFLLYAQTIGYGFALDDRAVMFSNKFVMQGFGGIGDILHTFYWAGFWEANSGLFRPLSLLLFAIEWQFAGNAPHVFHFVNVVLYALSALLLYRTLRELFSDYTRLLPLLATLLWVVMPVHTEVVANIKSADEILSIIFFLLAFRQLLRWNENRENKTLAFSAVYFFLALLAKEGAALFLPVMLLALYLFRKTEPKKLVTPFVALLAVALVWLGWHQWVIAHAAQARIAYTYHDNALVAIHDPLSRFATAAKMQGLYLLKSLFGFPLSYDYSFNDIHPVSIGNPFAVGSVAVCAGLLVFAFWRIRKSPVFSFGILFYFTTFVLTSNIFMLIGATMADRFLFTPGIGFAIAVAWGVIRLTKSVSAKTLRSQATYLLAAVSFLFCLRTFFRSQAWKDEPTLFTTDVENSPGSARVHYNYGIILMTNASEAKDAVTKETLLDSSAAHFRKAFAIDSLDLQSCFNLGVVEYRLKNYSASVAWSRRVLVINPGDKSVLGNLGDALTKEGKNDSAVACYKTLVDNKLATDNNIIMMGYAYLTGHDTANALRTFEMLVQRNPNSIEGWDKLANVYGMNRQYEKSTKAFLKLLQLQPSDLNAYRMIFTNYKMEGDTAKMNEYWQLYLSHGGQVPGH